MRELYRSEYFLMTVDDEQRLVRRARTGRRFDSASEIEASYRAVAEALATIERRRHVLLIDVRLAPPRNDPAFEQLVVRYRPLITDGFLRTAYLLKTEVGKLQVGRMLGDSAPNTRMFGDESAALSYLLGTERTGGHNKLGAPESARARHHDEPLRRPGQR